MSADTTEVVVQVRPPATPKEPRHPSRRKPTQGEADAIGHYPASQRRDLLRRLRARELFIDPSDGLLHEVDPKIRDRARQKARATLDRWEAKKKRRREASASRAKNRRQR